MEKTPQQVAAEGYKPYVPQPADPERGLLAEPTPLQDLANTELWMERMDRFARLREEAGRPVKGINAELDIARAALEMRRKKVLRPPRPTL